MEWAVVALFALLAAALIAWPRPIREVDAAASEAEETLALAAERERLLAELREFDDDAAAGRISVEDRQAGRRALAPRLRDVTEALRARGAQYSLSRN